MRPAFLFLLALLAAAPARAQTVDPDYHVFLYVPFGLSSPRALTFLPDGRVLVAEKATGKVRVIKAGALLAAPFADVPVNSAGDRGALGLAAAPDFATSHAVYLLYARSSTGLDTAVPAQVTDLRLVRLVAAGDTAVSETVVRNFPLDPALPNFVGGGLRFGPEGALYLGLGTCDALPNPALLLDQLRGKILRLDPLTGQARSDNVFALDGDPATLPDIFAFGFHDPAFLAAYVYDQPGPPKILASDRGDGANDEVDEVVNGKDYGYPVVQGKFDTPAESAYVASHVRYRPPAWTSGAASVGARGVAAAVADYGFFPVPAFWWGQANGVLGVGWDAFTLPAPAVVEDFGRNFPKVADVSFRISFPMPFLPDFDTLYVAAGDALYQVRKNGAAAAPDAAGIRLAHAGAHPAAGSLGLAYALPPGMRARLEIVDLRGRIVAVPLRAASGAGVVRWDAGHSPAGLYFARLVRADGIPLARLSLVRL